MRNKYINVVVKLHMEKVYDKGCWIFLTKVLRTSGFVGAVIDMVWRLVFNKSYSILSNYIGD